MPVKFAIWLNKNFHWLVVFLNKWEQIFRVSLIISILILSIRSCRQSDRIVILESENYALRKITFTAVSNNLVGLSVLDKIKRPIWVKLSRNGEFYMQYCNTSFEKTYLLPYDLTRMDYIGKSDAFVFGEEAAKLFYDDDLKAALTGEQIKIREDFINRNGVNEKIDVLKWREISNRDTLVWGMVTRDIE